MQDERIVRGMRAQLAVRAQRIADGDRPLGWKAGFGSGAAMSMLATKGPLIGHLMQSGLLPGGTELTLASYTKPAVETEIAVHLGADIHGGADRDTIRSAIAGLGPAIEIVDVSFPSGDGIEKILAGNIYQQGVVLGAVDRRRAGADLDALVAGAERDGIGIDMPADLESNTGSILDVVAAAADTLAAVGEHLRAGEIIITGSLIPPLFVDAPLRLSYTLGDAEPISIAFV